MSKQWDKGTESGATMRYVPSRIDGPGEGGGGGADPDVMGTVVTGTVPQYKAKQQ